MRPNHKIKEIEELVEILVSLRARNKKIVHSHGVFDLLHIGHIRHLEQAKRLGDILVVTVTPDGYVNKGPHRPAFTEDLRAEAIAALDCVDYVAVNKWPTAVETIQLLRPDFYAKGAKDREAEEDSAGGITLEEAAIRSVGGQIAFTDDITFSTSNLINRHLPVFPKEVSAYLADFSTRYHADDVLRYLECARSLKVLVVGEAIIDEYQYCETIGKSGKEPILAARYVSSEKFAGGVLAAANHVAAFCDQVGVLTFLGTRDSQEDFIRAKIDPKIDKLFLYMDNAPTIVKRRFVEVYPFQKLFEVYVVMDDGEGNAAQSRALCTKLIEVLPKHDVVIVTDYGHGMLGPEEVDILCNQARFLAVNTQVNAENRGFNTISKYHRADYISISENEIRLEARSRRRDLRDIVLEVAEKLSCERILITRGQQGCLCYSKEESFFEIPAFTSRVVDRVGAGDAVLAVTTLCVAQNAPMEVVGFIGNAVGAQAVATVGHRKPIERVPLFKHIESLLK
jgi:rfaE bifunctional protein kinase chain/domain/rfaE bifunctional protein nucleotidyltransferase chain/domain